LLRFGTAAFARVGVICVASIIAPAPVVSSVRRFM
jgi:hypothetical protein